MTDYHKTFNLTEIPDGVQPDYEQNSALRLQQQWLNLESVRRTIRIMGWDHRIHWTSSITYRDVRDTPRYNWHKWMSERLEREMT